MSKRLFISSLTAAFSLGTAFGLAIDEAITQAREASTHADKQILTEDTALDSGLICQETRPGQTHCWPKENAPEPDSGLTCIESGSQSLCFPAPGPKLP